MPETVLKPEEKAREFIDKQLRKVGWNIVNRIEYTPVSGPTAIRESLMQGNTESDYLLFVDNKAIAVVEAKRNDIELDTEEHRKQVEDYAKAGQSWIGSWFENLIPLVFLANGKEILFKNMLTNPNGDYQPLKVFYSPKKMLQILNLNLGFGALPFLEKGSLRDCQYEAEINLEQSFRLGEKKALSIMATGSGKTYLACLASYRMLNYTDTKKVLFLVDRNNLAKQAVDEYSAFTLTENGMKLSQLYQISKLTGNPDSLSASVVVSTIQKLFALLTGKEIVDDDNTESDEDEEAGEIVLEDELKLPPDYFQFIIVDECHRSIYGKWQNVLKYFKNATILGLTATPTEEAYAFFNNNVVENYSYEQSVVDGVNVPFRIYDITTKTSAHGNRIEKGATIEEVARSTDNRENVKIIDDIDYTNTALDHSIVDPNQIEKVIRTYKEKVYCDLFPTREQNWAYVPKTLIFAKDDNHATNILTIVNKVFGEEFGGTCPEGFAQKITYSSGNSNDLIRDFRTKKEFRIAITVTLVATGTDVKPLEVVLFMKDVKSDVLYTQMKGRACRYIGDDKLKDVTPNADTKSCFYLVDAVGVTKSEKHIPHPSGDQPNKRLSLEELLEHLSHGDLSDDNFLLLKDYCSSINSRYEHNPLFGRHLNLFIQNFGFAPRTIANNVLNALDSGNLPPFIDASHDNKERLCVIAPLITNLDARAKLIEMQHGYSAINTNSPDELLHAGFSVEEAKSFIENFEKCLIDHKDNIEALRIIYNSEDVAITHSMLVDLRDRLLAANRLYTPYSIWQNYRMLDESNAVEELDIKHGANCLTDLMQIVRFAFKKSDKLSSLYGQYAQRFSLFCGRAQRILTNEQKAIMKQIADYIIGQGAISINELRDYDTDLWRRGLKEFRESLEPELNTLTKFILKVA